MAPAQTRTWSTSDLKNVPGALCAVAESARQLRQECPELTLLGSGPRGQKLPLHGVHPGERPREHSDPAVPGHARRGAIRAAFISLTDSMNTAVADIEDRADCERLVRAFYSRALADPVIGWIFVDVARLDLEAHVPQIASFWETILLDARSYSGGAFRPHAALNARVRLRAGHFERWLWLWRSTVDELFAGPRAELAKSHAQRVARAFQGRLQAMSPQQPGPGGLAVTYHEPG